MARGNGVKAGLLRPLTLWPFPEGTLQEIAARVDAVLVPEMNDGQLSLEVQRLCESIDRVEGLNRLDGEAITPGMILSRLEELAGR